MTSEGKKARKYLYPASDRNLEIWLAETNTICSDIMLPYYPNISNNQNIPPPRDLLTIYYFSQPFPRDFTQNFIIWRHSTLNEDRFILEFKNHA